MPSGPSKQELEMYWKGSRQYFDELAKYYKESDRKYYDEYIAPFYNNPFNTISSGKRSSGGRAVIISIGLFMIAIGSLAAFLLASGTFEETDFKKIEKIFESSDDKDKKTEETKEIEETKETESISTDTTGLSSEDNFIIGSKAIGDKDYDKAEKHLKRIKPGDKYYKQAQQLLESLKYLRKYDK